jgi:hypothetical protein
MAKPSELSKGERRLATLLIVIGILTIVILMSAFMARSNGWALISKETREVTKATAQAGEKTSTSTEYSDSVLIAGLSLGAVFLLTGAFYARIREITLPGGAGIKLGELPPREAEKLNNVIAKKAKDSGVEDSRQGELIEKAQIQAKAVFDQQYWGVVPEPQESELAAIAETAVDQAKKLMGNVQS